MKTKEYINMVTINEETSYLAIMEEVVEICEHNRKDQNKEDYLESIWEAIHQVIDGMCIYTQDCKDIISDLDYDIFEEHPDFGRAKSWAQGAYNALYDVVCNYGIEEYLKQQNKI